MEIRLVAEHLKKETVLFKEFISVLRREAENLAERDYKGLYELAGYKKNLLIRIERLGRSRRQLMGEAAERLGICGEANLTSIIEKYNGELKEEIRESRSTILLLLENISEINRLNSNSVSDLVTALNADDSARIHNPLGSLKASFNRLPEAGSDIDGRIPGFNSDQSDLSKSRLRLKIALSDLQEDQKVVSGLNLAQMALQASMTSAGKVFGMNILNYL